MVAQQKERNKERRKYSNHTFTRFKSFSINNTLASKERSLQFLHQVSASSTQHYHFSSQLNFLITVLPLSFRQDSMQKLKKGKNPTTHIYFKERKKSDHTYLLSETSKIIFALKTRSKPTPGLSV